MHEHDILHPKKLIDWALYTKEGRKQTIESVRRYNCSRLI